MKQRNLAFAALAVIAAAGAGVAGVANAGGGQTANAEAAEAGEGPEDARELATLNNARVSLAQAVTAAEAHTGLKAMEAGIDDEGRGAQYEVSVMDGTGEKTVLVDTQSGRVTQVVADAQEAENENDAD